MFQKTCQEEKTYHHRSNGQTEFCFGQVWGCGKAIETTGTEKCNWFISLISAIHTDFPKAQSVSQKPVHVTGAMTHKQLPSMEYRKNDSEIQAKVDKHLRRYEDFTRDDTEGMSGKLKSGRTIKGTNM